MAFKNYEGRKERQRDARGALVNIEHAAKAPSLVSLGLESFRHQPLLPKV